MRPSTSLEDYYIYRNILELSTTVSVTATYSKPVFADTKLVYRVLETLINESSHLRTNYKADDTESQKWHTEPLSSFHLDDVVKKSPYTEVSSEFLESTHAPDQRFEIGSGKPLWRLHIVNDSTACFSFDHAVMDGLSGMLFHDKFRATAEKYTEEGLASEVDISAPVFKSDVSESEKEMLNGELCFSYKPSMFAAAKMLWLILVAPKIASLLGRDGSIPQKIPKTLKKSETRVELINIDSDTLAKVQSACKKENVRLVCWVVTCLQLILKDFLPQNRIINSNIPVNVRGIVGGDQSGLGLYVCGYTMETKPLSTNQLSELIQISQERSRNVDNVLADNCMYQINSIGLLSIIPSIKDHLEEGMNEDRSTALECSNLGLYKQPQDSKLKIIDMIFSNADYVNGSAFAAYCSSTVEGGLNVSVVCNKEYSEQLSVIVDKFSDTFASIAE